MPIAGAHLPAQLQRQLQPLYTLLGDDPLLQQEALDAIRQAAKAHGHHERQTHIISGAHVDWSAVLAAGQSMSLFAERLLVEVRIPSGKPGKDGGVALQRLAESAAQQEGVVTVVALPKLDATGSKSAWFAALERHGVVVRLDPVERAQLPQWIAARLQRQGQRVAAGEPGQRTLAFLADRVEGHLLAAHQEIQKLGLLYPAGELSLAQVEQAVVDVARYDPFQWPEAVLEGQVLRMQRMLDGLRAEGTSAVVVHYALAEEMRALWRVKGALATGKPMPMALREQRIWGVREKRFEKTLPRLPLERLAQWVQEAHTVDGIVKGLAQPGWPSDPWQALAHWASAICRACSATGHRAPIR
jgi:DNA polymerase III subunit delta